MSITAADLPVELLAIIVGYVGTDERGRFYPNSVTAEEFNELKRCSLVCLDWANWCRRCLFAHRPLRVKSLADLVTLETYAVSGSERLTSLHSLVRRVVFEQDWTSASWCHRAYGSSLPAEVPELILRGPIPAHLPPAAYQSPHWSLPRSMPRCCLPFGNVTFRDVHFPYLSHLGSLTRHFVSTPSVRFEDVTWADDLLPASSWSRYQRDTTDLFNAYAERCTENALPCILAFTPSLFAYMDDRDRGACVTLLRAAAGVDGTHEPSVQCRSFLLERGSTCHAAAVLCLAKRFSLT